MKKSLKCYILIIFTLLAVFVAIDVSADINTELFNAIKNGKTENVKILLEYGADVNAKGAIYQETPLIVAARRGNIDLVNILLKKDADVNAKTIEGETALILASGYGITNSNYGMTCLSYPENKSFINTVNLLLENGADVNIKSKKGMTALIAAARGGFSNIVKALLENGADVNAKTNSGETALTIAQNKGHNEIVIMLKKADDAKY